jgi:ATP/maltotriose-dependent transcriptional regulator MalT/two-component SAPR family response regulator
MKLPFPVHEAKFARPRLANHVIARPAIISKLREALNYPLTLIRAGAGYGKSTLLNQALPERVFPTVWLNLSDREIVPALLLSHLAYAINEVLPGVCPKSIQTLTWDERQGSPDPFAVVGLFGEELRIGISGDFIIILDDFQYIGVNQEILQLTENLINVLPPNVHVIISSREKVKLSGLILKRAKGEVLEIGEEDLAFKDYEIKELFRQNFNLTIDEKVSRGLAERTEGWIMAIHMLGQHLKKGKSWNEAISDLPLTMGELFEFLLNDYLANQPLAVRQFLMYTAYLQFLKADDCDSILGIANSNEILHNLENKGFFIFHIDNGLFRYHHLFQEYLQKAANFSREDLADFHYRAAAHYRARELTSTAVEHLLAGGFYREAGLLIKDIYQQELASGRQNVLENWLDQLPHEIVNSIPELLVCRGDICRLSGDFSTALKLYSIAEKDFDITNNDAGKYLVAKACALVYLDSVQPVLAEQYLNTALALVDNENIREQALLYNLMAENNINLGCSEKAATLFRQANELFMEESRGDVEARMHIRTGRLTTGKNILLRQQKKGIYHVPKSHRETPLLLSLINSFMGDADDALSNALEGLEIGKRLNAIFVEAVAHMRIGHAMQLRSWTNMEEAINNYHRALEISAQLGVQRGKAEPLWGLCLVYGYQGNLDSSIRYGLEGLQISQAAKDDWISAMIELSLAIAYQQNGAPDKAEEWVLNAQESCIRCGDSYIATVAMFWHAKLLLEKGDMEHFREVMDSLLLRAQAHDYDFIFYKPTLLGLRDVQVATPILLAAHRENIRQAYAGSLLTELGMNMEITHHPGYTLRVQTLGAFRIWRGLEEIRPKEWQREKAKKLFQYLVANRRKLMHKEQIIEALWGGSGSDSDFKVALNALINALEPGRNARTAPFYISKQNSAYGLNLAAGLSLDVDAFESYINRGDRILDRDSAQALNLYRMALNGYVGDFLPDCCYDDWCHEERERLLMLYITTAEKMAFMLFERGEFEECISLCIRILGKDRCWETAYQLLMRCYHQQNNRAMVVRVFKQCRESLQAELGVPPTEMTTGLFKKFAN